MSFMGHRNQPAAERDAAAKQTTRHILWGFVLAALCPTGAWGQTVIDWRSPGGGAYAISNNWNPGNVPDTTGESARFALDATYTVLLNSNTTTDINDLLVEDGDVTFRVSGITGGSVLRTDNDAIINGARLTLAKPNPSFFTLTLEVDDLLLLGNEGVLEILDGSDVNVSDLFVAPAAAGERDEVTVSGTGSTLSATSVFDIGFSGQGTMTVRDGAEATSGAAVIGDQLQGDGEVVVTGDGSMWNNISDMGIGREGQGLLSIEDGGMVASSNDTTLGVGEAGTGTVIVNGDESLLDVAGTFFVGLLGKGTLRVESGAHVNSSMTTILGLSPSGQGEATVTGSGSVWQMSGGIIVGLEGQGSLTVADGGAISSQSGFLGLEASGAGDVTIDGAGSEWSLAFGLNVGLDGAGSLTVRDGGAVTAGDILEIGTSGTVRLAGGTIIADDVVFTGNEFHFTGGTLRLRNDQSVTFSRGAQLGLQELSIPQTFIVDGNLALETSIVLDGGTLTAGSITGGTNVRLLPGATLNVLNQPITIAAGKTLGDTLDLPHAATVNIAQGLNNQGLITGDGSIGGTLTNDVRGQIRVTPGDRLTITGENFVNRGTIHLLGGVLKFAQPATNAADALIAGNGSLATAGMSNSGTIALSGITNVLGDVTNRRGGTILSTGGGPTTFFDDVTNDGDIRTSPGGFTVFLGTVDGTGGFTGQGTVNFEGDLTPGASPATVTFEGNVIFGASSTLHIELAGALDGEFDQLEIGGAATLGGELVIELIDLFSPAAMDTFAILEAGTLLSSFDNVASGMRLATLGGEGSFLVNYDGTTNSVLLSEFLPALTGVLGDTDDDRDVDIDDLNAVRNNFGTMGADDGTLNGDAFPFDGSVSIDDLNAVRNNFGVMAAVPEPATDCLLLIAGIVPVVCRPRRRK